MLYGFDDESRLKKKVLRCMHMHITWVSFERFKRPRMAYIISC